MYGSNRYRQQLEYSVESIEDIVGKLPDDLRNELLNRTNKELLFLLGRMQQAMKETKDAKERKTISSRFRDGLQRLVKALG